MSIRNLTEDNDLDLICRSITVKTSASSLTGIYSVGLDPGSVGDPVNITTSNPSALLFVAGDYALLNGSFNITVASPIQSAIVDLTLPTIIGYNAYNNVLPISGSSVNINQIGSLTEITALTINTIRLTFGSFVNTDYQPLTDYKLIYTIRYQLTNI